MQADSDGYYCVGPDYLAYQLRGGLSTNEVTAHVLRVVRFGKGGIRLLGELTLPDFQPVKFLCEADTVRIGGFIGRPIEYVIGVRGDPGPVVEHVVRDPQQVLQRSAMRNLGAWSQSGATALPSSDRAYAYQLVITGTEERAGDEILHHKRAELVMTDGEGQIVQRLELFSGHRVETID